MQNRNYAREPPPIKATQPFKPCHTQSFPGPSSCSETCYHDLGPEPRQSLQTGYSQLSAQSLQNTSKVAVVLRLLECHLQRFWNVKALQLLVGQNQQVMQIS